MLAVGDGVAGPAALPSDVDVVTRAGDVPRLDAPPPLTGVAVLVPRADGGASPSAGGVTGVTAVAGTARAAGAT